MVVVLLLFSGRRLLLLREEACTTPWLAKLESIRGFARRFKHAQP
jgi:hypothetical protein